MALLQMKWFVDDVPPGKIRMVEVEELVSWRKG